MKKHVWVLLLLGAITAGVFGRVVCFDFVEWDDPVYVQDNAQINEGLSWGAVKFVFSERYAGNWHPLTGVSILLDATVTKWLGLEPARDAGVYHATSALIHVINTFLMYGAMWALTRRRWASLFVAGVFALHPLHVESVAWISERKDVLSGLFGLAALWAYAVYARRGGLGRYLLVFLLLGLGLLSKPMLVTWPLLMGLLDYWPLRRGRGLAPVAIAGDEVAGCEARSVGRLLLEKVPLLGLSLAASVVTYVVQQGAGAMTTAGAVPLGLRLVNGVVSYVRYVGKLIWPVDLAVLYPHPNLPGGTPWAAWEVIAAATVLLGVTVGCLLMARRRGYLIVGWLWFLGTLVPVVGVVQVGAQAMADRFMYLPATGLMIMAAWGVADLAGVWRGRLMGQRAATELAAVVLLVCTGLTCVQIGTWRDSETVLGHAIEVSPRSSVMRMNLGLAYKRRAERTLKEAERPDDPVVRGQFEKDMRRAIEEFEACIAIEPNGVKYRSNLALIHVKLGDDDEALRQFRLGLDELAAAPDAEVLTGIHFNMAKVLARRGDVEGAIASYRICIATLPGRMYTAHFRLAELLAGENDLAGALEHYERAWAMQPAVAESGYRAGVLLLADHRYEDAVKRLSEVVQRHAQFARAHHKIGVALAALGRDWDAVRAFLQAAEAQPDWPEPLNDAAWVLATGAGVTKEQGREAVRLAQRACGMVKYQHPGYLDTLAAAYAAAGEFDRAVEVAEEAVKIAAAGGATALAAEIEGHLALFRQSQPVRRAPATQGGATR